MICIVQLKDGTRFMGKRGFWQAMKEGWRERIYKVISSSNGLPEGVTVLIPLDAVSYIFKTK